MTTKTQEPTKGQPTEGQEGQHDIFQDPAISKAVSEDPFFRFLHKHWTRLLIAVALIAAGFYAKSAFEETYVASMSQAADLYSKVRSGYRGLVGLHDQVQAQKAAYREDPSEEVAAKLQNLEQSLADSQRRLGEIVMALGDARDPYKQVAGLYDLLLLTLSERHSEVSDTVKTIAWEQYGSDQLAERFLAELKALVAARALLDSSEHSNEGVLLLEELGERGRYVHTSAALSFARIADSDELKGRAVVLLERVLAEHPEQVELISEDLKRLKEH